VVAVAVADVHCYSEYTIVLSETAVFVGAQAYIIFKSTRLKIPAREARLSRRLSRNLFFCHTLNHTPTNITRGQNLFILSLQGSGRLKAFCSGLPRVDEAFMSFWHTTKRTDFGCRRVSTVKNHDS
jgi:hypothetical protein